jgi:hypothetical protein
MGLVGKKGFWIQEKIVLGKESWDTVRVGVIWCVGGLRVVFDVQEA